jgi:hypothetical protein
MVPTEMTKGLVVSSTTKRVGRTCGSQPAASREWMTSSLPLAAASMSAVRPS